MRSIGKTRKRTRNYTWSACGCSGVTKSLVRGERGCMSANSVCVALGANQISRKGKREENNHFMFFTLFTRVVSWVSAMRPFNAPPNDYDDGSRARLNTMQSFLGLRDMNTYQLSLPAFSRLNSLWKMYQYDDLLKDTN
ncbi:hypothetical protein ACTXT7_012782, partial [Hymenolepis weldensis]